MGEHSDTSFSVCTVDSLYSSVIGWVIVSATHYVLIHSWRNFILSETAKAKDRAKSLLTRGYVLLDNELSLRKKQKLYHEYLLPQLLQHWSKGFPMLRLSDQQSWPKPENDRFYESTLKFNEILTKDSSEQSGTHLLLRLHQEYPLFSSNYQLQSTIAYIFDSKFRYISFRERTHWKFLLLSHSWNEFFIRSYNYIVYNLLPIQLQDKLRYDPYNLENDYLALEGEEFSWYLTNWPNPNASNASNKQSIPLKRKTHIDSGYNGVYSKGVPLSTEEILSIKDYNLIDNLGLNEEEIVLLCMIVRMLIVYLHYDTPAEQFQEKHGVTGVYPFSHIPLLIALKQFKGKEVDFQRFNQVMRDYGDHLQKTEHDSLSMESTTIKQQINSKISERLEQRLIQPNLHYNQSIAIFGLLSHTTMVATEAVSIPPYNRDATHDSDPNTRMKVPRTIENCKVFLNPKYLDSVKSIFSYLDSNWLRRSGRSGQDAIDNSLLLQFIQNPLSLCSTMTERNGKIDNGNRNSNSKLLEDTLLAESEWLKDKLFVN
jgi:hypothetical protein